MLLPGRRTPDGSRFGFWLGVRSRLWFRLGGGAEPKHAARPSRRHVQRRARLLRKARIALQARSDQTSDRAYSPWSLGAAWIFIGAGLVAFALLLVLNRHRFDWSFPLAQIPALPLTAGLVLAGAVFLLLLPLVRAGELAGIGDRRWLLASIVLAGLVMRLLMFATEPALEDDQQRYLWEGALVAHGISPYRVAPDDAKAADRRTALGKLAERSGPVLERVNHPGLKTIYPPVAQGAFALAHVIAPFNLTGWRSVLLAADGATLWLLLLLVREARRSSHWVALYWWNPLVIKEVFNSGHMEGVLVPFVLLSVLLAVRRRFVAASGAMGLAIGVKLWPVLLAPLLLRPLLSRPREAAVPVLVLAVLSALWAWPVIAGGLDQRSGFVAYAESWQANSAVLPGLRDTVGVFLQRLGIGGLSAGQSARLILAATAAGIALWLARCAWRSGQELIERVALLTLALLLLSPAQFPWYALWAVSFLPFVPRPAVAMLAVTMPIYYASFYFSAVGRYEVFRDHVVWLVWLPVWGLLLFEAWRSRHRRRMERDTTG